jgi:hypothetical protein
MDLAQDVYFLLTINHVWTKARLRDAALRGFGLREICLTPTPPTFPATGFQLGMVHWRRGYNGAILLNSIKSEE